MLYEIKEWGIEPVKCDSVEGVLNHIVRGSVLDDNQADRANSRVKHLVRIVSNLIEHLKLDEVALSQVMGEQVKIIREPTDY